MPSTMRLYLKKSPTEVFVLINLIRAYCKMFKHFSFARFLLTEVRCEQDALRNELIFAPSVERFKSSYLQKVFLINLIRTYSKLLQHFIFACFLLIKGYEQGALGKELTVALFVERFKIATLRKTS